MKLSDFDSVLFLGVGGVSMHQIADACLAQNKTVFGYDMKHNSYIDMLTKKGMHFSTSFNKSFLSVDLCIKTGAISDNNKYVTRLRDLGVKIIDRAEALSMLSREFKTVIAVAGTHGKSTTASLIYEILRASHKKVSCHIGADVYAPRFKLGDDYLVVEACEYNKSFLSLYPDISVVTNVESEHMDSYGNLFNLRTAFQVFLRRAKTRFVMQDNSTEYLHKLNNVNMVAIDQDCNIKPKISGEHNLKNISLALAVVDTLGVERDIAIQVINKFEGVSRRYQYIGQYREIKLYIDYAHHPTEIRAFYEIFSQEHDKNIFVFQPHTYSRTKYLLKDFVRVLSAIPNLIIYKEYPAREKRWQGMTAYELYKVVKKINPNTRYSASQKTILKNVSNISSIAFVGAGDINQVAMTFKKK